MPQAAKNSRLSMLHYLASLLQHKTPELYQFNKQLEQLFKSSLRSQQLLKADMDELVGQLNQTGQPPRTNDTGTFANQDTFEARMSEFRAHAEQEMQEVEHLYETMVQQTGATTTFFGEPEMRVDELFRKLSEFIQKYKEAQMEHKRLITDDMLMSMNAIQGSAVLSTPFGGDAKRTKL